MSRRTRFRGNDQLIFDLSREALSLEHDRNDAADSKAGQYLALVGIMIGAAALGPAEILLALKHPSGIIDNILTVVFCVTLAFFAITIVLLYRVLDIHDIPTLPVNREWYEYLSKNDVKSNDAILQLGEGITDAVMKARDAVNIKYRRLRQARWILVLSFVGFVVTIALDSIARFSRLT
jgi:hypothetical protein